MIQSETDGSFFVYVTHREPGTSSDSCGRSHLFQGKGLRPYPQKVVNPPHAPQPPSKKVVGALGKLLPFLSPMFFLALFGGFSLQASFQIVQAVLENGSEISSPSL